MNLSAPSSPDAQIVRPEVLWGNHHADYEIDDHQTRIDLDVDLPLVATTLLMNAAGDLPSLAWTAHRGVDFRFRSVQLYQDVWGSDQLGLDVAEDLIATELLHPGEMRQLKVVLVRIDRYQYLEEVRGYHEDHGTVHQTMELLVEAHLLYHGLYGYDCECRDQAIVPVQHRHTDQDEGSLSVFHHGNLDGRPSSQAV
jgi:hypothetical protein